MEHIAKTAPAAPSQPSTPAHAELHPVTIQLVNPPAPPQPALFENPVIVGAGIALAGVVLSQLIGLLTQWRQRRHDTKQRLFETRKGVYLEGAAWISAIEMTMGKFTNMNVVDPGPPEDYNATPAKMQVVANQPTYDLVDRVSGTFVKFLSDFSPRRLALRQTHEKIMTIVGQLGEIDKKADPQDQLRRGELVREGDGLAAEIIPALDQFQRDVIERLESAAMLAAELQISMSLELGFKVDREVRLQAAQEHNRAMRAIVEAAIERQKETMPIKRP